MAKRKVATSVVRVDERVEAAVWDQAVVGVCCVLVWGAGAVVAWCSGGVVVAVCCSVSCARV